MPLRKPLELSEILGVQVKYNACGKTESFPFPLDKPEKIGCPHHSENLEYEELTKAA